MAFLRTDLCTILAFIFLSTSQGSVHFLQRRAAEKPQSEIDAEVDAELGINQRHRHARTVAANAKLPSHLEAGRAASADAVGTGAKLDSNLNRSRALNMRGMVNSSQATATNKVKLTATGSKIMPQGIKVKISTNHMPLAHAFLKHASDINTVAKPMDESVRSHLLKANATEATERMTPVQASGKVVTTKTQERHTNISDAHIQHPESGKGGDHQSSVVNVNVRKEGSSDDNQVQGKSSVEGGTKDDESQEETQSEGTVEAESDNADENSDEDADMAVGQAVQIATTDDEVSDEGGESDEEAAETDAQSSTDETQVNSDGTENNDDESTESQDDGDSARSQDDGTAFYQKDPPQSVTVVASKMMHAEDSLVNSMNEDDHAPTVYLSEAAGTNDASSDDLGYAKFDRAEKASSTVPDASSQESDADELHDDGAIYDDDEGDESYLEMDEETVETTGSEFEDYADALLDDSAYDDDEDEDEEYEEDPGL